jgi:hypothetical protein
MDVLLAVGGLVGVGLVVALLAWGMCRGCVSSQTCWWANGPQLVEAAVNFFAAVFRR